MKWPTKARSLIPLSGQTVVPREVYSNSVAAASFSCER